MVYFCTQNCGDQIQPGAYEKGLGSVSMRKLQEYDMRISYNPKETKGRSQYAERDLGVLNQLHSTNRFWYIKHGLNPLFAQDSTKERGYIAFVQNLLPESPSGIRRWVII